MTLDTTQLVPCADRTLIGPSYTPYHPRQHDSEPDSYYRLPSLRVLRPLSAVALRLQNTSFKCERNLKWSIDWAVAFIVNFLDGTNSEDAASKLRTIRIRAAVLAREGQSKGIPYRIFNKLDETLFAGHLNNAVYLDIRNLGSDVSGATHCQGWGLDPKVTRVSVVLNREVLEHARSRDVVAILIHHMIHAYFLVACGPQREEEVGYGRLAHGLHFGKIMMIIKKLSAAHGRPLAALDFGYALGQSRHFYDEYQYRRRKPDCRRTGKEKWYCSHCYSKVDIASEKEIDKWYNTACKPLFELPKHLRGSTVEIYNDRRRSIEEVSRAKATASTASKEFIFQDRSVLVPTSCISNYFSIGRAFEKAGSRYMKIDKKVTKDTFEHFLELLHTGAYNPDPKHIFAIRTKGPPIVRSPTKSEPYLLTDIRILNMSRLMGFDELKRIALDRMYRHSITHEDPVALLEEIYNGPEPDFDLKKWTRKFLMCTPNASDGDWMGLNQPSAEPSNLAKLECDLLGHKPGFCDLLEKSSALKYEVGEAKQELVAKGMYAARGIFGGMSAGVEFAVGMPRSLSPPMSPYGMTMPASVSRLPMGAPMVGLSWVAPEEWQRRSVASAVAAPGYLHVAGGLGYDEFSDRQWLQE